MRIDIHDHPIILSRPERLEPPFNWQEHIPFAMFLIDLFRPDVFVELGTHSGNSYCAFCQAVSYFRLTTQCFAIDSWQGDVQAGDYGKDVLDNLRDYHDPRYGSFSHLIQNTFDEARSYFPDGFIDLLHIDGLHTYEAVKHDVDQWLPKMSRRGIILLHDINVRERDFGVYRVWDELATRYPHFSFLHGNGLGILAVGEDVSDNLRPLFEADTETTARVRLLFAQLGFRLTQEQHVQQRLLTAASRMEDRYRLQLEQVSTSVADRDQAIESLREEMRLTATHADNLQQTLRSVESNNLVLKQEIDRQHTTFLAKVDTLNNSLLETISQLEQSKEQIAGYQKREKEYEQQLEMQEQQLQQAHQEAIEKYIQEISALQQKFRQHDLQVQDLNRQLVTQQAEYMLLQRDVAEQQSGIGWAAISRMRAVRWRLLPGNSLQHKVYMGLRSLFARRRGRKRASPLAASIPHKGDPLSSDDHFLATTSISKKKSSTRQVASVDDTLLMRSDDPIFSQWLDANVPTPRDLQQQRELVNQFTYKPLISIVVPCYNVAETWLRKCIESVLRQSYSHWELCIVDDHSTEQHIRPLLEGFAAKDSRIKVYFAEDNRGIAAASNICLDLVTGEFVGLLDNDDELAPHALFSVVELLQDNRDLDIIYSDEDKISMDNRREMPHFKPDFSYDFLLSNNYICHFLVLRRSLIERIGCFREGYDGAQDYDLVLRAIEYTERAKIAHIPDILYHWRAIPGSTSMDYAIKPKARDASLHLLDDHLLRTLGENYGVVRASSAVGIYDTIYTLQGMPLVSIVICTKDKVDILRQCVDSIHKTTYGRYEVVIVDNGSVEQRTHDYYSTLKEVENIRVISYDAPFNYSAINNFGILQSKGDIIVLLNNDTEVITPTWIETMLGLAQQSRIGIVGAKLLFPNKTIQHAGVVLGLGGIAGHTHKHFDEHASGYFNTLRATRNYSAVTGACMMFRRAVWEEVNGLSEDLAVLFNDVDFCLKIIQAGYDVVYTPNAVLWHHESVSLGKIEKKERTIDVREVEYMRRHWGTVIVHDPFYNPNLSLLKDNFSIEPSRRRPIHYSKQNPGFRVDPALVQEHYDKPLEDLVSGNIIEQSFVATKDNLFAIEFLPGTHDRINKGVLYVTLLDEHESFIKSWHINANELINNVWRRCTFDMIDNSADRCFKLRIESQDSPVGAAITLWHSTIYPVSVNGQLYVNNKPILGGLAFRAFFLTPS